jgi:hypothetical protein
MLHSSEATQSTVIFRVFLVIALGVVVARAMYSIVEPLAWAASADNDDIMRLLSVRGWLDGQGWFDMRQYRMMPPEGLDLHWSRYIDAAIAGLVTLFSAFLPSSQAENLALVSWPTLLLVALVILTGETARRVFGTSAAILAVMSLLLWPLAGLANFAPYRIDHHNVQILLISIMVFSLIVPGRPFFLGVVAGLAGAVSLAVGLEMLLVIGLVGIMLAVRTLFHSPGSPDQLTAFSIAMFLGSIPLFIGQTAADVWYMARCDQLSPPYIFLAGMAALISVALARVVAPMPSFGSRAIVFLAVSAAGGAALLPVLGPCLSGPYASLPPELNALIQEHINEGQGILRKLDTDTQSLMRLFAPAFVATLIAGTALAIRVCRGQAGANETRSVGVLLVFAALGIIGSFSQIRMLLLAVPAVPLLTGYGLCAMLGTEVRTGLRGAARSLAVVLGMAGTIFLPLLDFMVREAGASNAEGEQRVGCRSEEALQSLSHLPKGIVFAPLNFGAPLLLFTPHDVVTGPYHRSPDAFLDGFVPFNGNEAVLREAMERTDSRYLLLCRDGTYGNESSFAHGLAKGEQVDWLVPVEDVHPVLVVFRTTAEAP